ncbi:hypothetical protein SCUP234_08965 [Seiridium cupressi]
MDRMNEDSLKKTISKKLFKTQQKGGETYLSCVSEEVDGIISRQELGVGSMVILLMLAGAAMLVYFKYKEIMLGGLPRPSNNFEVLQLLGNYIPTVFVTFLEPFWVLLNRILCLVQPFRRLQKGNATAQHMIDADYTSLMPQFNVWRALRSSHYSLTIICVVVMLANVLAVGLGGIFNEVPVDVEYGTQYQQRRFLNMSRDTVADRKGQPVFYTDHEQLALSNLSTHTTRPSWTTPEAYFLPFAHSPGSSSPADVLKANTTGVSLEPRCSVVTTDDASETYVHVVVNTTHQQLSLNSVADDGSRIQCGVTTAWLYNTTVSDHFEDTVMYVNQPMGQSSLELVTGLSSIGSSQAETAEAASFCSKRIVFGWLRVNATATGEIRNPPTAEFTQCELLLHVASYEVKVDSQGPIHGQERVSDLRDAGSVFGANRTQKLLANMLILATTDSENEWHNATITRDWVNTFMKLYLNTASHINPQLPVPDPEVMLPALEVVLRETVAVMFGLNPDLFNSTIRATPINGFVVRTETRIFMSNAALIVSLVILFINIAVAVLVYTKGLGVTLPRLPSTIGSILAYVAASRAVEEYTGPDAMTSNSSGDTRTYTFGGFIGSDGEPYVGIELDPYVLPLETRLE